MKRRIIKYGLQLALTLLALAYISDNTHATVVMAVIWALTFGRATKPEALLFAGVCALFTLMNAAALSQGIFVFRRPDVLGMPVWEFFMWGFYVLHTKRLLGGPVASGNQPVVWVLAVLFGACFAVIPNQTALLAASSFLIAVALLLFHERNDLLYTGYMVILGALVEYTGVLSGQWFYPGDPPGGVPLWFITMWGGIGLFLRRLALPIVMRYEAGSQRLP